MAPSSQLLAINGPFYRTVRYIGLPTIVMTEQDREILKDIDERKTVADDLCLSCDGTCKESESVICSDCLGQGCLLYGHEYNTLLRLSGRPDDGILEEDDWDRVLDINLKGNYLCLRYEARAMLDMRNQSSRNR